MRMQRKNNKSLHFTWSVQEWEHFISVNYKSPCACFFTQKATDLLNHSLLGCQNCHCVPLRSNLIERQPHWGESQALDKQHLQFCQKDFTACCEAVYHISLPVMVIRGVNGRLTAQAVTALPWLCPFRKLRRKEGLKPWETRQLSTANCHKSPRVSDCRESNATAKPRSPQEDPASANTTGYLQQGSSAPERFLMTSRSPWYQKFLLLWFYFSVFQSFWAWKAQKLLL